MTIGEILSEAVKVHNIVSKEEVSAHIVNAGIEAKIDGRVKHFFSIYKKMVKEC